jgi:hypothetical protein
MSADPHAPEPELPEVVALLFCERVTVNQTTGAASVTNIFGGFSVNTFPYVPNPPYMAFAILGGIKEPAKFRLRIVRDDDDQEVFATGPTEVRLNDPNTYAFFAVELHGLRFDRAGQYALELWTDTRYMLRSYRIQLSTTNTGMG